MPLLSGGTYRTRNSTHGSFHCEQYSFIHSICCPVGVISMYDKTSCFTITQSFEGARSVLRVVQAVLTHLPYCCKYASEYWVSIGWGNGLSLIRRQAITQTNANLLPNGPLRTSFSEILIEIQIFSFKKMLLKMSSAIFSRNCPEEDVLNLANVSTALLPSGLSKC